MFIEVESTRCNLSRLARQTGGSLGLAVSTIDLLRIRLIFTVAISIEHVSRQTPTVKV